jgi:hypothetical protein
MKISDVKILTATLPPRTLIHGREGTGKTTVAAKFPDPVFLQTEDGCPSGLELASFGPLETLPAVQAALGALAEQTHNFRTVVLDSLDAAEPMLWAAVCREKNWASLEAPGYGRGYVEADRYWLDLLAGFDWLRRTRGMNIVLLAHSAVETVNDPRAPSYTSYQLRLHKRARALVQDWCDAIGFLSTDVITHTEDSGFGKKRVRADAGSQRYLHFEGRPAFIAKNRYGLPARMPVPIDLNFNKLSPFFPPSAWETAATQNRANAATAATEKGA